MGLGLSTTVEVDSLSRISIYFNIPILISGLHRVQTKLVFSDNKTLLAICRILTGVVSKEG
jgi:hypothetical protein